MKDADETGCRLACGIISDIANSVATGIVPFLGRILPALQETLQGDSFEPGAKLTAIIAIGDVCLASEEQFTAYAPQVLSSFRAASQQSLQPATDDENRVLLEQLRIALLDGYISVLHGLQPAEQGANMNAGIYQTTEMDNFSL